MTKKQNELRSKIEEEFKKSCGEELGFVSAIFMSQGKIKAKDIVMPTTELEESVDRFGLYLFEAMEKLEDLYKQEIAVMLEKINKVLHKHYMGELSEGQVSEAIDKLKKQNK